LGGLVKSDLENRGIALANELTATFARVDDLRDRLASELAAGTLDGADFYPPGDPVAQQDKTNLLGFCDNMHQIWGTRADYIKALIGV